MFVFNLSSYTCSLHVTYLLLKLKKKKSFCMVYDQPKPLIKTSYKYLSIFYLFDSSLLFGNT